MSNWKSILKHALQKNIEKIGPSATYISLATVKPDHTPSVRTMVLRGFAGEHHSKQTGWQSDLLVMTTNKNSRKMKEIENNFNGEINWFMSGTFEQFRLGVELYIVDNKTEENKLLSSHFTQTNCSNVDKDSLALKSFHLKQQQQEEFSLKAERLRQFIQLDGKMRATFVTDCPYKSLEILEVRSEDGWFLNHEYQDVLEEAFDNFVLLIIKVICVRHWSPSTGLQTLYISQKNELTCFL